MEVKQEREPRTEDLHVRLTEAEKELVRRAAQIAGTSMDAWCRRVVLLGATLRVAREAGR